MKMKKLLSVGALGLVLACSTSIGASAAERPTNDEIKQDMVDMLKANKSILTSYNVKPTTKVKTVVNTTTLTADAAKYGTDFETLNAALALIDPNVTIVENAASIYKGTNVGDLLTDVRALAVSLRDIENNNNEARLTLEKDVKTLITQKNTDLDVKFGKNKNGNITMSITKGTQVILQLNSQNAYTISDALGDDSTKLDEYATLLGLL